jgi:preprotein translocase subunit SecY
VVRRKITDKGIGNGTLIMVGIDFLKHLFKSLQELQITTDNRCYIEIIIWLLLFVFFDHGYSKKYQ